MRLRLEDIEKPEYRLHVKTVEMFLPSLPTSFMYHFYRLTFDEPALTSEEKAEKRKVRHAFAQLRKAMKAYRWDQGILPWLPSWSHQTSGTEWHLHHEDLLHFADWMEFEGPLETLMQEAEARAQQRCEAQRKRWASIPCQTPRQFHYFDAGASPDQLKVRYRQLAKEHHPDLGGDPAIMKAINQEYEALTGGNGR